MSTAALSLDVDYRYRHASCLDSNGRRLRLATWGGVSSANGEESLVFFEGQLLRPRLAAEQMRALYKVVQARFHVPAAMLGRVLALADPVVTCHEDRLRWEGFSSCCGAYARIDWLPAALRGEALGRGTTNIDFNPPLLAALASLATSDRLELTVGQRAIEFRKNDEPPVVEKKVKLPLRWLKGFVEVQSCLSRMQLRFEIDGLEARRFFRELPRMKTNRRACYVVPAGRGLRVSQLSGSGSGSVRVGGLERLRTLETLAPHAETLRVFGDATTGASAWELDFGDSRFQLAISPEVWRGFSGEGQALARLATREWRDALPLVRANLKWQAAIDVDDLAVRIGTTSSTVDAALAALGARGLVGFDVRSGTYFHRELPFQLDMIETLQPRLVNARKLYDEGRVTRCAAGAGPAARPQTLNRDVSENAAAKGAMNEYGNGNGNGNEYEYEYEYEHEYEHGNGNVNENGDEHGNGNENGDAAVEYWVRTNDVEHRVVWSGDSAKCTCPWFAKHGTARGPCKHILAVQLVREETEYGG